MSERRELGRSGLRVAPLCLGGNVFGWTIDEPTSFRLLDAFVAAGVNFIDTADVYSAWVPGNRGGESETIIGRWLAAGGRRDRRRHRHQGRHGDGAGPAKGLTRALHPAGGARIP